MCRTNKYGIFLSPLRPSSCRVRFLLFLDNHKEIETTNMAFPLPGETISQASLIDPLASNRVHLQQPLSSSWNAIVSGNQPAKQSAKQEEAFGMKDRRPLSVSAKESVENKPQKPSPIFGSQHKQAIKKPTAHVKPLKCNNDGFTTVHSSRQQSHTQSADTHTGSRVSELDDFSTDFPIPAGNINTTDYPVAGTTSSKAGAKKKKKKNKEPVEQISEVWNCKSVLGTKKCVSYFPSFFFGLFTISFYIR